MQTKQSVIAVQSVSELMFSLRMRLYVSIAAAYGMASAIEDDPLSEMMSAGLKCSLHEAEILLDTLESQWRSN